MTGELANSQPPGSGDFGVPSRRAQYVTERGDVTHNARSGAAVGKASERRHLTGQGFKTRQRITSFPACTRRLTSLTQEQRRRSAPKGLPNPTRLGVR